MLADSTKQVLVSIAGAVVGGAVGFFGFQWLVSQGFYGLVLPGGLLGIGAACGKSRSIWVPVGCAVSALALGLVAQWHEFPFRKDASFGYFLGHVTELKPLTFIMLAAGAALAFWMPFRRMQDARRARLK